MAMIEINTSGPVDVRDITIEVEKSLQEDGIQTGIALISTLHTTTGLTVNEAAPALMQDMLNLLEKLAPESGEYLHDHGERNAHAHLRAALIGNSVTVPVMQGRLSLGTWQRIIFFEFDGPRRRRIQVKTISIPEK